MVQLLIFVLHKYLNEKPSMCDLFNMEGAHTHRGHSVLKLLTLSFGLWAYTRNVFSFLFYDRTISFSDVTALLHNSRYFAQCHLSDTDIETACRSKVAHLTPFPIDNRIRVICGQ